MTTKIIELIYTDEGSKGLGTEDNPVRSIKQLFTKDGQLIASEGMKDYDDIFLNLPPLK